METGHAKPLGYFLRHIDTLLEQNFADLLSGHGLVRRSWQVLNTIARGPTDLAGLDRAHAHFRDAAESTVAPHVQAFIERDWVSVAADGLYVLTQEGQAEYRRLSELIDAERAATLDGLTPDDYRALLGKLQRISDNLESVARSRAQR
ncbi:MarR family winged helix-turn-helix transcriptional regulator [Nocardia mexicana]|uniref:DNA-binding MarR family transcriptional regulator n=1 Tax=Nocardia mexicana TaxID=279262 RepID=A0A370H004_9NOCA|nr:MarR family winged helix-turn-helix transcriptional regulator [Nocardia mexicana]RDI49264.1 DNA-binding MarR family transcriptional regulator [Nocardia mexicana]